MINNNTDYDNHNMITKIKVCLKLWHANVNNINNFLILSTLVIINYP